MSQTTWTSNPYNYYANRWFNSYNWSNNVPVVSATGTQSVVIDGSISSQPIISPKDTSYNIWVAQTLNTGGAGYTVLSETQIAGEYITLTNGADLTIQGIAMGVFYGNSGTTASGTTMTGLHGALSTTPSYDSHMQLIALGTDTLTVDTVNENFGLITIGSGDKLTIDNKTGGNAQQLHGLINYGLISVSSGGSLAITAENGSGSTVANFYNAGWIVDNGGTISISSSVLDGANNASSATTANGYIELGGGGDVILSNTVSATEQVTFTDSAANTLQITAGTLFSGTVNNFGSGNTILVNGFTSTSNATITTVGGVTELITTNGSVLTTITLTGSVSSVFSVGTNASGQEYIMSGGNSLTGTTSYTSGTTSLVSSTGTVINNGTLSVTGSGTDLVIASSLGGTGTIFIDYGATVELDNPSGNDAGQTVVFGTHGAAASFNTLLVNDNSSGFGGHVTGFGSNDDIILGASALPTLSSGEGIALSYSGGVLTVAETNSAGSAVSSTALTIAGTSALSTASFVALENAKGLNIETAPTASTSYSFSGTGSFEDYHNYTGGTAPGDVLSANMTVAITSGAATVTSGGVTDNGLISVASGTGFIDGKSLSGTGKLTIASGGNASLTGNTTLGSIADAGTLTLGGSDAVAISLASGAQATIASAFSDSAAITGTGTLTVKSSVTATLASGSSIASVIDAGTLSLAGAMGGSIDMKGNGAQSVADLNAANLAVTLTNFGTTDDIILGSGALAAPGTGNGLVLSYSTATNSLTVTETNSSGAVVGTDVISVTGAASLSTTSFVALENARGINIEIAPTSSTSYSFTTSGSFEDYNNYAGGTAPGDVLSANMTVAVAAGAATVTTGGVTDNGLISIASGAGFIDAKTLSGSGALTIAAGGSATLAGNTTLGGITDAGSLALSGNDAVAIGLAAGAQAVLTGNFTDSAAITGTGTLSVGAGVTGSLAAGSSIASVLDAGTLALAGSMGGSVDMQGNGAGSVVDFIGANVTNHTINTAITNFGSSDKIILGAANFALSGSSDAITESYSGGVLTVTDQTSGATVAVNLGLAAGDSSAYIQVNTSTGELELTLCFYPGTALATPAGEIKVEEIRPGDVVMTMNGPKPVRWVGQNHVHTRFADPVRSLPIHIRAGALGDGLPRRDLRLSPDHALFIDGILVQASALVNGSSITRDYDVPEQFTYYHIELESHELLLAEGTPAESFVDNVDRMHFHNWDERTTPETPIAEMDLPRAKSARQVPQATRRRLGLGTYAVA